MPNYQRRIVYLSEAQREELFSEGSITVNGTTITYDANDMYVTPQEEPYVKPSGGIPASDLASDAFPQEVIVSDTQPTNAGNKLWIGDGSGTTYSVPTMDDLDNYVQDVQVNGTSIVSNGVANVPYASSSTLGVVKIDNTSGLIIDDGVIKINASGIPNTKDGTSSYRAITPYSQHASAFYGLAKAAGADMASSSNAVGTYTDAAKIAIQKMLGIYQAPWELIREYSVTEEAIKASITVDSNGNEFSLFEAIVVVEMKAGTATSNGGILINTETASSISTKPYVTLQNVFGTSDQTRDAHLLVSGGKFLGEASGSQTSSDYSPAYLVRNRNAFGLYDATDIHSILLVSLNGHSVTTGTKITIYGRRK